MMSSLHNKRLLLLLLAANLGLTSPTVWAQACAVTNPSTQADFGALTSFAIANTPQQTSAQPGTGLRCRGSVIGLIMTGDTLNASLTSGNQGQLKNTTGDGINYQIYADQHFQEQLQLGTPYNYYNSYILDLLGLLGGSNADIPMYFRIPATATHNLGVGAYSDTLSIQWDWNICTGIGLLNLCLGRDQGTATSQVNLHLEILPDCAITAPDVNFGSAPLVVAFTSVTQTISIRCTKGQDYSVGINDGLHADGTQRRLHHNNHYLHYDIYQGTGGNQRWGRQGPERRAASDANVNPGNLDGLSTQGFHYRAEIDVNQATPPPGTYTDTLVIDVAF